MTIQEVYTLSNGYKIPTIGFGTWQTPDGEVAKEAVFQAIQAGYRHIDTASAYKNERSVGDGIKASGVSREELFITTKLGSKGHSHQAAKNAIDASLQQLQLDYVDLYLIHWPNPLAIRDRWQEGNALAWRAMEESVAEGKIRSLGVSNFLTHHLDALFESANIKPVINQLFLNPSDQQEQIVDYNKSHDILSEGYSPLGTGKIFEVKELQKIAKKYNKTVAQLAIRWSLQQGFIPLPKSIHEDRIRENLAVFDFVISEEDLVQINQLRGMFGVAPNPDFMNF
ncbi:aldo/keto reductase [Listeria monocytogenes]|nr:aldo/keto reductase [Listeria monocytogenes]EHD1764945.1 aldo/keto reductase [Listeria monocytogenes]